MAAPRIPQPSYEFAGAQRDTSRDERRRLRLLELAADAVAASDATKIADAPVTGDNYARKDGAWVRLSVAVLPAT